MNGSSAFVARAPQPHLLLDVVGHLLRDAGQDFLDPRVAGDPASGNQQRAVRQRRVQQSAVAVADRRHDTAALVDLAREPLQPRIVRVVPHHRMAAGEVDRIEIGRIDLVGARGGGQQRLIGLVGAPRFRGGVGVRPFERKRGSSGDTPPLGSPAAAHSLSPRRSDGHGSLGQPQAGRLGRIGVVRDVADHVKDALARDAVPFIGHGRTSSTRRRIVGWQYPYPWPRYAAEANLNLQAKLKVKAFSSSLAARG